MSPNLKPLPAWLAIDERQSTRLPLDLPAMMHLAKVPEPVAIRVADISQLGCLIVIPGRAVTGGYVTIDMPNGLAFEGWIAWSKGGQAGVDFSHPLLPGILALLTRPEAGS